MPTNSPLTQGRLQSIDALRGIAALGVVFYHAISQSAVAAPANLFHWPVRLLQFGASLGYIGVFLFFVISGFCIHLQWARARANEQPQEIKFTSFWRRRFRRLYPPYLITLVLFMVMAALTSGINLTHFFVYDVVLHLLMLHNLDPHTCYSINGVFWTLAVEEQLYLAYFLLLFLRKRLGWGPTLLICGAARIAWFLFSHAAFVTLGLGIPVPEAAASHWFTWALGAIAVEAAFGLVKLPQWTRNLWIAGLAIVLASATSIILPATQKDTLPHNLAWLLMHPAWGLAFFIVVNRAVQAEQLSFASLKKSGVTAGVVARLAGGAVAVVASIGVFSYSLYLTHELVIMQSWWFVSLRFSPILNALLIVIPATVLLASLFYGLCEKPFMKKTVKSVREVDAREERQVDEPAPVFTQNLPAVAEEA